MDQIYIPKNRLGFSTGAYVLIKPLETKKIVERPVLYNIKKTESIKLTIIMKIFGIIGKNYEKCDNIIITGSFLEKGFSFNDIDILIISENTINLKEIKNEIEESIGIKADIMIMNNKTLIMGLATDPLYHMMLSRCISKKRVIYKKKYKIKYKILDMHLLKSRPLIDNFDALDGNEKYYLTRNMVSIYLFLKHKRLTKENVDNEILKIFNLKSIDDIKKNMLDKDAFLKKYKDSYSKTFNKIMEGIKYDSKQKQVN